jgi:hypothetical protein
LLDPVTLGQPTDAQLGELFDKLFAEGTKLESWEFEDLKMRPRVPGRFQPGAVVTMTYRVSVPGGELKHTEQPIHWLRKSDGRWLIMRPLRPGER